MRCLIGLAVLALVALEVHSGSVLAATNTTVGGQSSNVPTTSTTSKTTLQTETTVVNVHSTTDGRTAVCAAYCDVFGYYVSRRICVSMTGRKVYCCGDVKYRYCCTDVRRKIQTDYTDVKSCPNSAWWLFHWRIIVGLLGTVMVIMMCGACVYYCCIGLCKKNERVQAVRRRFTPGSVSEQTNTTSMAESRPTEHQPIGFAFDPSNPNAFVPPPYDSLPKDPPKYTDLFNQGQDNQAFQAEASSAQGAEAAAATAVVAGAALTAAAALSTSGNEATASGGSAASGATGTTPTSAAAPASPNRTTVVTPPLPTMMPGTSMAEVAADSPPPYSRADPGLAAPPRVAPMNQAAAGATAAPPSVEAVQRIEVGAAAAARPDTNTSTSPV